MSSDTLLIIPPHVTVTAIHPANRWPDLSNGNITVVCPCGSGKPPRVVGTVYGCDDCAFKIAPADGRVPDYVPGYPSNRS